MGQNTELVRLMLQLTSAEYVSFSLLPLIVIKFPQELSGSEIPRTEAERLP